MNTGTDPAALFATPSALRAVFEDRLAGLLEQDLLGVFILVLANASFERGAFERLREPLADAYLRWCGRFDSADPRALEAAPDDVTVFRGLRDIGFEHLVETRWRSLGPWELQFNPLRALRPPRMSGAVVNCLHRPFDPAGFHFDRPFLRKEILWEGDLAGVPVRLLFNKFPFAELHGLLVPEPAEGRPQWLTAADHQRVWRIAQQLGRRLPGLGLAYNAYGAYSSVNHLHFQLFMRSVGRYPIESPAWMHNGGDSHYPLPVQHCTDVDEAWQMLERLHAEGRAYNLLYRPGAVYLVPRAMQGSYTHSAWTGGFAWSEVAGAITTFDENDFLRLSEREVEAEFARLAVRP